MALPIEKTATSTAYASFITTEVAIIDNCIMNNCWTFGSRKLQSSLLVRFIRFHLIALFSLPGNVGIAFALVQLGIRYLPAQAIGILCAWIINYQTSNRLVFQDATHAHFP